MRRPAVFVALFLVVFSVSAQALSRISPTEAVAGGPMFTLRGFADQEPFDPDERTLTWRRADQPGLCGETASHDQGQQPTVAGGSSGRVHCRAR